MVLTELLITKLDVVVTRIIRHNIGEEESIGISNGNRAASLRESRLVALTHALERRRVRCWHHAIDINDIEGGLILHSQHVHGLDLQDVSDALLQATLASLGPFCCACLFLEF